MQGTFLNSPEDQLIIKNLYSTKIEIKRTELKKNSLHLNCR